MNKFWNPDTIGSDVEAGTNEDILFEQIVPLTPVAGEPGVSESGMVSGIAFDANTVYKIYTNYPRQIWLHNGTTPFSGDIGGVNMTFTPTANGFTIRTENRIIVGGKPGPALTWISISIAASSPESYSAVVGSAIVDLSRLGTNYNGAVISPLIVTEEGTYTAPSGTDGYSPVVVDLPGSDVNFIGLDGEILYSYTAEEFAALTEMPELPASSDEITTETKSGSTITFDASDGNKTVKDVTATISFVQSGSGTPSVDNVRNIAGWAGTNIYVSPTSDSADATVYNVYFGSTGPVYGGSINITTGLLTVTHKYFELAIADMDNVHDDYPGWLYVDGLADIVGSDYNKLYTPTKLNIGTIVGINTTYGNVLLPMSYYNNLTQTEWKEQYPNLIFQMVASLLEPVTYQLTPVEVAVLTGTNNIWADCGDVSCDVESHSGTDISGWNWSLADAKAYVAEHGGLWISPICTYYGEP